MQIDFYVEKWIKMTSQLIFVSQYILLKDALCSLWNISETTKVIRPL